MSVHVGSGWKLTHLTDRVIELKKDDHAYRHFTERDGYVRVRVEPNETRQHALDKAISLARRNDEILALRIGKQLIPSKASLAQYLGKQLRMVPAFGLREQEPEQKAYRP